MDIEKENQIKIFDEDGNEKVFEILFTYENEERGTNYVFIFDPEEPEDVFPMIYHEDHTLEQIEDDEEYAEVEEVFNAYMEDPKIQELKKD